MKKATNKEIENFLLHCETSYDSDNETASLSAYDTIATYNFKKSEFKMEPFIFLNEDCDGVILNDNQKDLVYNVLITKTKREHEY